MAFDYTRWLVYAELHHPEKLAPRSTAVIDYEVVATPRQLVKLYLLVEEIRGPAPGSWGGRSS